MLPVTITSNCFGAFASCIAALSTYMCDSSTSAYSFDTSIMMSRQNCDVSSTFALSTDSSFFARAAAWNATCAMRRTSGSGIAHRVEAFALAANRPSGAARRAAGRSRCRRSVRARSGCRGPRPARASAARHRRAADSRSPGGSSRTARGACAAEDRLLGRSARSSESYFQSPTAPNRIASASFASFSVASGSGWPLAS